MEGKQGKCKIKSGTMFNLRTFGASCQLFFGNGTKFDYEYKGWQVELSKPGVWLTIPAVEFEAKFTILW